MPRLTELKPGQPRHARARHASPAWAVWAVWAGPLLLGVACHAELPSEVPLGSGPLAFYDAGAPLVRHPDSVSENASSASDEDAAASSPADAGAGSHADAGSALSARDADVVVDAGAVAEAKFAGEYAGSDRATIRISGQAPQIQDDPKARIVVKDSGANQISITLIDSNNGSNICSLNAKTQGSRAEVLPGQVCFGGDDPNVTSRVQKGIAEFNGGHLTFDMSIELQLSVTGEKSQNANGSIEYHFDGARR